MLKILPKIQSLFFFKFIKFYRNLNNKATYERRIVNYLVDNHCEDIFDKKLLHRIIKNNKFSDFKQFHKYFDKSDIYDSVKNNKIPLDIVYFLAISLSTNIINQETINDEKFRCYPTILKYLNDDKMNMFISKYEIIKNRQMFLPDAIINYEYLTENPVKFIIDNKINVVSPYFMFGANHEFRHKIVDELIKLKKDNIDDYLNLLINGKQLKGINKGIRYYVLEKGNDNNTKEFKQYINRFNDKGFYYYLDQGLKFYDMSKLKVIFKKHGFGNFKLFEIEICDDSTILVEKDRYLTNKYNVIKTNVMNDFLFMN